MEREWRRLANNLNFTLDGVARIFLPAAYARRFRADPPEYVGQISFADQKIPCLALLTTEHHVSQDFPWPYPP